MRATWHRRVNSLVLLWLLAAALVALAHRWVPMSEWLLVHLLLLGAVSTAVLVWSAHFAEAVRRRPLPGGRTGQAVRLGVHSVAALAVVTGMVAGQSWLVAAGGAGVALTVLWHAVTLARLGRGALGVRLGFTAWYFVAAGLTLPVGVALGVLLARSDTAGPQAAQAYVAHVAVMMLGWVGLTVVGTMVTLWPTMLRVQLAQDATTAARHGLPVLAAGLLLVLAGAWSGIQVLAGAGLIGYLLGLLRASWPLVDEARRRAPETFASRSVGLAWLWLVTTVAWWAVLLLVAPTWDAAATSIGSLLGPLTVGFAAQVLLGALTHLVPTVLGGGPSVVRAARAAAERGGTARLVLTNGGLLAYLLPVPSLVRVGMSVLVLGALMATPVLVLRSAVLSRRERDRATGDPAVQGPALPPVELLVQPRRPAGPALAAVAALALVVAGGVAADPAAVGIGSPAAQGVEATGRVVTVDVEARDMRFVPDSVEVAAGDELVLRVHNVDDAVHDLVLDSGATTGRLAGGATALLEVGVVGRGMDGWCSVAGHRQMGMVFTVVVVGAEPGTEASSDGDSHEMDGSTSGATGVTAAGESEPSAALDLDFLADPGAAFAAADPVLAPAPAGTVHRLTLPVVEKEVEVAPGVTQMLWTFGGTAPGPTLRGAVGDTFVLTLVNDGSLGHSIDFHAGALAPDEPMRTIGPGESLTYTFTATRSGIWMYHCSTMPMSLHIANGMFGAVVIDPPGLPEVDREYLVVQSELYLGAQGGIADAAKVAAEQPDAVVFNGHANQYDHDPLVASVGDRVRIWVLDVGPNRPSAFHVVGGQFDTVFFEGAYQLGGPDAPASSATGGSQVLGLLPAQGGFVELVPPQAGHYPIVSHLMVDAERGAHGVLEVTD